MHHSSIKAYAKANLALDVLAKTKDDYHSIQTVLYEMPNLFDEIIFDGNSAAAGCTFSCNNSKIIFDEKNTLVKAVDAFEREFGKKVLGTITLIKNIPISAGLGGGSSDAAALLRLLVSHFNVSCCPHDTADTLAVDRCHAPSCRLYPLARVIGMDVSFFINGGTQYATHFGEILTPLPSASELISCTVVSTHYKKSTRDAYASLDLSQCGKNLQKTEHVIEALHNKNVHALLDALHNDFGTKNSPYLLAGSGGAYLNISQTDAAPSPHAQA